MSQILQKKIIHQHSHHPSSTFLQRRLLLGQGRGFLAQSRGAPGPAALRRAESSGAARSRRAAGGAGGASGAGRVRAAGSPTFTRRRGRPRGEPCSAYRVPGEEAQREQWLADVVEIAVARQAAEARHGELVPEATAQNERRAAAVKRDASPPSALARPQHKSSASWVANPQSTLHARGGSWRGCGGPRSLRRRNAQAPECSALAGTKRIMTMITRLGTLHDTCVTSSSSHHHHRNR